MGLPKGLTYKEKIGSALALPKVGLVTLTLYQVSLLSFQTRR